MPDQTDPQMMAQALSGGMPLTPPQQPQPVIDKSQAGPGIDPSALSALFLVPATDTKFGDSGYYHIKHDSGRLVGHADLDYSPGTKNIHVNMVRSNAT
jgi:hypothetical protein